MKKKTRDIVIDADHILFLVCESKTYKDDLGGRPIGKKKESLKRYKDHFKAIVADYITTAEVESVFYRWGIGKVRVILSDHRNFRYDIYPEYKAKRPSTPEIRKRLKKWAMKKYHYEPNTEADDVVAYYVRKGALGFTTDKDLFNGVEGLWYNCHYQHRCWIRTSKEQADYFFKQQVLGGDGGDGIPSIEGVALTKAKALLKKHGSSWSDILSIFKDKGYDKKYMVTMTRLVCMSQWHPKKGITLWEFPNDK